MTGNTVSETVDIRFHYDQAYRERVIEEADPDSWIETSLRIGDDDVYGGSYRSVTGFACQTVLQLLASVEAVHSGDRSVVQFDYGPSWLSVDPIDERVVEIAACHTLQGATDPEERLDVDRVQRTTAEAWKTAVLELANDFQQTVVDIYPELDDHDVLKEIRSDIRQVERIDP